MDAIMAVLALGIGAGLVLALALAYRRVKDLESQLAAAERSRQADLQRLRWQQEGILKAVDEAVLVLDAQRLILTANPAAEALLGSKLAGESLIQVVDSPALVELVQSALLVRGEAMERRVESGQRMLHARAVALQHDGDQLSVLTLRDVTEIQRLERARREMVSNISHELSTPITAIGLLADTLFDSAEKEKPKRLRKMAGDIKREVDTLTQLVQEMRDLSLIESGQMPIRLTPAPLLDIVQASVKPLEALAEGKQQIIEVNVPGDITVLADSYQLQRALKNILHNAVKYAPRQGQIDITATVSGDEAIVAVQDDGPGIASGDLPRIFERFYQADRARRTGTGLGLAIVRHILKAHGGRVWAESTEGEGATFFLAMALAEPDRTQPDAPHPR